MSQASTLHVLEELARSLVRQFGPRCEAAVHDLTVPDRCRSIAAIENGQISGRAVGDGPSPLMLEALRGGRGPREDHVCGLRRTRDGKMLKSSVCFYRDEAGAPAAALEISYDISLLLSMEEDLRQFTAPQPLQTPEGPVRSVNVLLDELIEESVRRVGRPVALMSKDDKVEAVRFLEQSGAFLITKSSEKICKFFHVSKYTLYNYIDEAKDGR